MTVERATVETAVRDCLDAGGDRLPAVMVQAVVEQLAPALPDGDWGDDEWQAIGDAVDGAVRDWAEQGDALRRECQRHRTATVGHITVAPNSTFVCQSGPVSVRERQLRDWPESPHWWVDLVAPDGEVSRVDGVDAGSWCDLLELARAADGEYAARVAWLAEQRRAGLATAQRAVRDAEAAASRAVAARDDLVRERLAGGMSVAEIAQATGLGRTMIYKIQRR